MLTDKEVTIARMNELVEAAVKAADGAASGDQTAVEEALRALDSLKQLKVNTQLLVETQAGKKVRKLTKHLDMSVKAAAAELVNLWKEIVATEAAAIEDTKKQLGGLKPADAVVAPEPSSSQLSEQLEDELQPINKRQKTETQEASPAKATSKAAPLNIPKTGDAARDKIRTQLAEALRLAAAEVENADPGARAADVETAVLKQNVNVNPKYKAKIRSIWVNLKDPKNPDFRRSVLQGDITGEEAVSLKPEEMASKLRQEENQKIREAAMFEAQRGRKKMATTDQFQCGRCKKRQTSYYQMQTRSADEPMTTFVICQVCDNRWKFC